MKTFSAIATAAAFSLAVPSVVAAQEQPAPAPVENAAENEKPQLDNTKPICKRFKVTGSRLSTRKVCRTAYGWKKHKEDTQDSLDQALRRNAAANGNQ